jgi:hypothetical protein
VKLLPAIAVCLLAPSVAWAQAVAPDGWRPARDAATQAQTLAPSVAPAFAWQPHEQPAGRSSNQQAPLESLVRLQAPAPQQQPNIHPAVVRIVAPGTGSMSFGSGTLVHATEQYGLVITNWHVINEATGQISVHFPDGFYSPAAVQKADRDWDLAILAIRKPNVAPVRLANRAPQPGEPLTIAGYGSGDYRAATGVCTQYVAPGETFPFEMVEVAVSARQGDSGGPIFNSRGELAGVLFGEGNGRTSGSYCGRVQWFLASLAPDAAGGQQVAMASLTPVSARPTNASGATETPPGSTLASVPSHEASNDLMPAGDSPRLPASMTASQSITTVASQPQLPTAEVASTGAAAPEAAPTQVLGWILAAIGVLAIILHLLKWMSTEPAKA